MDVGFPTALRRGVAWLLIASIGLSGCALRRDASVKEPQKAPLVQIRLDNYPLGTHVRLQLNSGQRVDGTLVGIDTESVSVESTPGEPPRVIARASIVEASSVAPADSGVRRAGAWVLIGVVGAFGALLFLALGRCWVTGNNCD